MLMINSKTIKTYTGTSGCYVSAVPDIASCKVIEDLIKGIDTTGLESFGTDELHCTIMYSPDHLPSTVLLSRDSIPALVIGADILGPPGKEDTVVIKLLSGRLDYLHHKWRMLGCKPTYDSYIPHISLFMVTSEKSMPSDVVSELNKRIKSSQPSITLLRERIEDIKD